MSTYHIIHFWKKLYQGENRDYSLDLMDVSNRMDLDFAQVIINYEEERSAGSKVSIWL